MKNKKGFVFVETMIVVVVLVSVLLIIYSSYTALISYERRLARYDDPAFIYKTKIVADFLLSLTDATENKVITNRMKELVLYSENENERYIVIDPDDQDMFNNEPEHRQKFFSEMYNDLNIRMIVLISKSQLTDLFKEDQEDQEDLLTSDFYRYLKTIDTTEDTGKQFYIAIMYAEKVNGTKCSPNDLFNVKNANASNVSNGASTKEEGSCTFYYSSLKLGKVIE